MSMPTQRHPRISESLVEAFEDILHDMSTAREYADRKAFQHETELMFARNMDDPDVFWCYAESTAKEFLRRGRAPHNEPTRYLR